MPMMSVSQETSGYIVNNSQGKIHTENADLISLLTENSSDGLIRKPDPIDSHRSTGRTSTVKSHSDTPLDVNNNSRTEKDRKFEHSGGDSATNPKTPDSKVLTGRDSFPKPKPSALLPSARGPSADVKDTGRSSSTSVYAVANPDILRASGITPVNPNQFFPKYVSLKSRSQTTPHSSTAPDVSASPVAEEESEEEETPQPSPRTEVRSPEKETLVPVVKRERKSPAIISADSLEFNDGEFDKFLTSGPPEKATTEASPKAHSSPRPPSIVIQEDTFESKLKQKAPVSVDQNLLQAPSKSGYQLKSHNPQSPEGFERDSLSSSVDAGEKSARVSDSAASRRSKVFIVRNDPESMSAAGNRKVYVESPTFTKDEEDEFRFVSSRIDDYNDMSDTYRQLDENTLQQKPKKKSSGKRVTYQDSDRFEDKNQLDEDEDTRLGQRSGLGPVQDVTYKSALKNSSRQESTPSPSKGLKLPDRPDDPKEQEELEREVEYQDTLKQRIDDSRRQLESADIPRLPLSPDTGRDFMRDSLDMAGETYTQNRGSRARDSLELYQGQADQSGASRYGEMENTLWRNPPPQPFSAPVYEDEGNQGPFQRQNAVDGYASEPDYRYQQRRDEYGYPEPPSDQQHYQHQPQVFRNQQMEPSYQGQPQYYQGQPQDYQGQPQDYQGQPQDYQGQSQYYQGQSQGHPNHQIPQQFQNSGNYDNSQGYAQRNPHISSFLPEDRGMNQSYDSEASYRPTYNEYYQNNQNGGGYGYYENGENGQYDNRSEVTGGYSNPQRQVDRFVNEDIEPSLEMVHPGKPKYNYISNNKIDYGKPPPKSYKQIRDIQNDEKARLETIFVKPKVKPKQDVPENSSARTLNSDRGPDTFSRPSGLRQKPASAEDLWAQRAASLQQRSAGKNGTKKKPRGKLVKYPSESGISPPQLNRRVPLPRQAFLPPAPGASPPNNYTSAPNSFPSSPVRRPLELKPISQEVITSDGQRISVDVNLKLMSPPPAHYHSDGNIPRSQPFIQDVTDMVPVGQQYPIMDYRNQQDYPETYSDVMADSDGQRYDRMARQPREDRESFSNAYPKIPPIPSSGESKHSHQAGELEDGYVAQFRKQREKREGEDKPWYKVYGINDYRKMQKEVQLGTLGPDLDNDTYKERYEKVQRQSQYARMVNEKNKQIPHKKPPSFPRPKDQDDIMNRRKVAIEYAKTVPKPAMKPSPNPYNSYEVASQMAGASPGSLSKPRYKQPVVDVIDLDKLQQRHERDKQNVAKIRENHDGVLAQNA